jgi:ATP-dependent Clp protease ATP-binding subunit ClpX
MMRWLLDRLGSRLSAGGPVRLRNAYCSFCRRSHADVGPLAEGPDRVFICGDCIAECGRLIADEQARRRTGIGASLGQAAE